MLFRLVFIGVFLFFRPAAAKTPQVVVSIAPLHSVAAFVMDGVGEPVLLISPAVSVHGYRLKPSEQSLLARADLLFWGGDPLETFLPKAIKATEVKEISFWQEGDDPHFWLSPAKMSAAAEKMAEVLAQYDPDNADKYRSNALNFAVQMTDLTAKGQQELAPESEKPYVVFHDAYHEFEKEFGLAGLGAVYADVHHGAGAGHLVELREKMRKAGKVCLFSEPQMPKKQLETLREGLTVVDGKADPLGAEEKIGKDFYARLIGNLIRSFKECLSRI